MTTVTKTPTRELKVGYDGTVRNGERVICIVERVKYTRPGYLRGTWTDSYVYLTPEEFERMKTEKL